jgi:hypothetical protein
LVYMLQSSEPFLLVHGLCACGSHTFDGPTNQLNLPVTNALQHHSYLIAIGQQYLVPTPLRNAHRQRLQEVTIMTRKGASDAMRVALAHTSSKATSCTDTSIHHLPLDDHIHFTQTVTQKASKMVAFYVQEDHLTINLWANM